MRRNYRQSWKRSVSGVGYIADSTPEQRTKYYRLWTDMLRRCYTKTYKEYVRYGAKGIVVSDAWHNFRTFADDVPMLPGYRDDWYEQGLIYLDKDKLSTGEKIYSKDTCCFLTAREQQALLTGVTAPRAFKAVSPDNVEYIVTGVRDFARNNCLDAATIHHCLRGRRTQHKGWTFSIV